MELLPFNEVALLSEIPPPFRWNRKCLNCKVIDSSNDHLGIVYDFMLKWNNASADGGIPSNDDLS